MDLEQVRREMVRWTQVLDALGEVARTVARQVDALRIAEAVQLAELGGGDACLAEGTVEVEPVPEPVNGQSTRDMVMELLGETDTPVRVKDLCGELVRRHPARRRGIQSQIYRTVQKLVDAKVLRRVRYESEWIWVENVRREG